MSSEAAVNSLMTLTSFIWIAWLLGLPGVYWLALRWSGCKDQSLRLIVQLLVISLIPAVLVSSGFDMSHVDSFDYLLVAIQSLREKLVYYQLLAASLIIGTLIAGLVTRVTRGTPALLLAALVTVWSLILLAAIRISLFILAG